LKAQLEVTRGFQSDVIATVWGALGVLAAMTLGLIAFGWWTNFRMYERDRRSLLEELTSTTATRVTQAEQALRGELQKERARVATELEALRMEIRTRIEQVTTAATNRLKKSTGSRPHALAQAVHSNGSIR
jgi:uncharacterized protein HemX